MASLRPAISISSYAIPFRVPGSQKDRQILHYFCVQGSYEIAGWCNTNFWTRDVLQQSHRDPVVRQALISLGSLHLEYVTTSTPENGIAGGETLDQYGKALRALRRRLEKRDPEARRTALTCCILFYCVEAALGNSEAAMCHLKTGLNLLSPHDHRYGYEKAEDFDALSHVFEGLDLQATLFDDERKPHLVLMTDFEHGNCDTNIINSGAFLHLDEAHHALVKLQNGLFQFLTTNVSHKFYTKDSLPASILKQKCALTKEFKSWLCRFNHLKTRKSQDEETMSRIQILLIHWQMSVMFLEANYPADQSVFAATPNFKAEEILNLAENMLRRTGKNNTSNKIGGDLRRNLSSETGIVAPLFALAMKCSDQQVCNRAIELLAASRRREGLYDAQSMVAIIQQFVLARQQKRPQFDEQCSKELTDSSFEKVFELELSTVNVCMDKLAECLKSVSITLS
jgi:hypothetical protein